MNLEAVQRLLPSLGRLGTQVALLSGGEPLLNPEWPSIARALRDAGLKVWLLTSGLSLAKHARRAGEVFDAITVSLDGTDQPIQAIRGLTSLRICDGTARQAWVAAGPRVTLQRANRATPTFVSWQSLSARSPLAVDVANPYAFGRNRGPAHRPLRPEDCPCWANAARAWRERSRLPARVTAVSPAKLRRILQQFRAIRQSSLPIVAAMHPSSRRYYATDGSRAFYPGPGCRCDWPLL